MARSRRCSTAPEGSAATGNPGLGPAAGPPPAWAGFRPLRVIAQGSRERQRDLADARAHGREPSGGRAARPVHRAPAEAGARLHRHCCAAIRCRVSRATLAIASASSGSPHGVAGAYIETQVQVGDVLDVSAPRGSFTLGSGDGPVVLLSAGVGATPVLAMLHALAAGASSREIWWIYGARDGGEHPFAEETRTLLEALPRSHQPHPLQRARSRRQAGARFRCSRTFGRARAPGIGRAARCRLLSVRTARAS